MSWQRIGILSPRQCGDQGKWDQNDTWWGWKSWLNLTNFQLAKRSEHDWCDIGSFVILAREGVTVDDRGIFLAKTSDNTHRRTFAWVGHTWLGAFILLDMCICYGAHWVESALSDTKRSGRVFWSSSIKTDLRISIDMRKKKYPEWEFFLRRWLPSLTCFWTQHFRIWIWVVVRRPLVLQFNPGLLGLNAHIGAIDSSRFRNDFLRLSSIWLSFNQSFQNHSCRGCLMIISW